MRRRREALLSAAARSDEASTADDERSREAEGLASLLTPRDSDSTLLDEALSVRAPRSMESADVTVVSFGVGPRAPAASCIYAMSF